jgi:hypothetical protein
MSTSYKDPFSPDNPNMYTFTDIYEAAKFLGVPGPPRGPVYDKSIPKLLEKCLAKAGTPAEWRTLCKHTLVNGRSLPPSETPPDQCWWELGHYFQKLDDCIVWHGLTVDCGEHCDNHTAYIYADGKLSGTVNCFRLGEINIDSPYVKGHLEAWLGRMRGGECNYWDEITGQAAEKTVPTEKTKPVEKAETVKAGPLEKTGEFVEVAYIEELDESEEGEPVEMAEPAKKKRANKKKKKTTERK